MREADVFVLLDDADFSKNSYTNRVRVQGDRWLSVPVKARLGTPINEVRLADPGFPEKHWGILRSIYGRRQTIDDFVTTEQSAVASSDLLVDANLAILGFLRERLGIHTRLVRSSDLNVQGVSTQRLVSIVSELNGDVYLSGLGGRSYQNESLFRDAGICVDYSRFDATEVGPDATYSALHALLTGPDLEGIWR